MNRGDETDGFSAWVNQASTDRNRYIAMAPDNIIYHKSARTYIRGSEFEPLFLKHDASRYFSQLRSVADGILDRTDVWTGQLPPHDAATIPVRGVNVETLRSVIAPTGRSKAIKVKCQSLSRSASRWHWIAPHAIGLDGFLWHTRTFCLTDKSFKDFLLSRIIETRGTQPSEVGPKADTDWNEQVSLEIRPHPELSDTLEKVIAFDYGMRGGKAKNQVRKALLYYGPKRLGLDTGPAAHRPKDQHIVLLNREKVLRCVLANSTSGDHQ